VLLGSDLGKMVSIALINVMVVFLPAIMLVMQVIRTMKKAGAGSPSGREEGWIQNRFRGVLPGGLF